MASRHQKLITKRSLHSIAANVTSDSGKRNDKETSEAAKFLINEKCTPYTTYPISFNSASPCLTNKLYLTQPPPFLPALSPKFTLFNSIKLHPILNEATQPILPPIYPNPTQSSSSTLPTLPYPPHPSAIGQVRPQTSNNDPLQDQAYLS